LERPDKYLGKEVEVEGTMIYTGKTPRGPLYTVNLPEQDYCVGVLTSRGMRITCYGLEQLCFEEYNNQRVVVIGLVKMIHNSVVLKVLSIKIAELEYEKAAKRKKIARGALRPPHREKT